MRLLTLETETGPRAAVQRDGEAVFVERRGDGASYEDVGALLRDGPSGLAAARRAAESGTGVPFEAHQLLRPVLNPEAVICVGLNYRSHIAEMGRETPEHPTLFCKLARALTDPYADVAIPAASEKLDYEGEVAAVIGVAGRDITPERAWEHVAGLTIFNDVTARDFQRRTPQWFAGKTFERTTPIGPAVVTLDEIGDVGSLELRVTVNGAERQRTRLNDLLFDVPSLVADLSRIVTLEPGDLIATGSPGGVGVASDLYLGDGDVVQVSLDRIGTIRNTFRTSNGDDR